MSGRATGLTSPAERPIRRLASSWGIQTSFINMHGARQWASVEALRALIGSFDSEYGVNGLTQPAVERRRLALANEIIPPVTVAWDGETDAIQVRVPAHSLPSHSVAPRLQYELRLDSGERWSGNTLIEQARTLATCRIGDDIYFSKAIMPRGRLPHGYYHFVVEWNGHRHAGTVISAPTRAYRGETVRGWGLFAPIYALRSERNWGVGDWSDAQAMVSWMATQGGSLFGTLPFLAQYLDTPCDISPYTPVSRLFWNELYVDPTRVPEMASCMAAQELASSTQFQRDLAGMRDGRLVDYRSAMAHKQQILRLLAAHLSEVKNNRLEALQGYLRESPNLDEYARFRAMTSDQGTTWDHWASPQTGALSEPSTPYRDEYWYHVYAQFVADEQVRAFANHACAESVALYLDFPLGTHAAGYDVWKYREFFATNVTVGAPPDPVFTTGQGWGFPPIRPDVQRCHSYEYFIAGIRHQMQHASVLRLDHVMGFDRLYWIPRGFPKSEGVYVRYPAREYYAILNLESHRHRVSLVGENLGVVPGAVTARMKAHGWSGMSVAYWEMAADPAGALQRLADAPDTIASLNTHDMFPFAAFWGGHDIDTRELLGMIDSDQAHLERWTRGELRARLTAQLRERGFPMTGEYDAQGALDGLLLMLAASDARWLLINVEDLWLEAAPQNIPGTVEEHHNWRQKFQLSIEQIIRDGQFEHLLVRLDELRRR